ncbi:MAG: hypothetical protein HC767_03060 [Akkermansiaceae bacterium]|nr:hypothetical protein [Akkermansiaceae bacterium]
MMGINIPQRCWGKAAVNLPPHAVAKFKIASEKSKISGKRVGCLPTAIQGLY